jgi:hypothetical protein
MAEKRVKPLAMGAKSLGALAPRVTKAAFKAHGFPVAALISDWPTIAGPDLARFTQPERLVWPPNNADARQNGRGATLHLCADGPRALEVQHAAPQIIERLNTHFGYRAVTHIRIVQSPVSRTNAVHREGVAIRDEPETAPALDEVSDNRLRAALRRLSGRVGQT